MKTIASVLFLFLSVAAMAQTKSELPAKEFNISLSESSLNLKPGESHQVTVSIVRSKSFAKGSVKLGSSSILPEGITLQFEPAEGNVDTSIATIAVASTVIPHTYQIVIKGDVYNKIKGTILKVEVANEMVVVK